MTSQPPQTLHKYVYASNNPVTLADPSGHFGLAEVGATIGISSILAEVPHATPNPRGIVGGGPVKTLTVDVVTWLIGADPFIEHLETANTVFGTNGARINIMLGRCDELPEERLGSILGRSNTLDDRCEGTAAAGNLRLGMGVKRLIALPARTPDRITLYYVPRTHPRR